MNIGMIRVRYINTIILPPLSVCQLGELGEGAGPARGRGRGELGLHDRKKEVGRGDICKAQLIHIIDL